MKLWIILTILVILILGGLFYLKNSNINTHNLLFKENKGVTLPDTIEIRDNSNGIVLTPEDLRRGYKVYLSNEESMIFENPIVTDNKDGTYTLKLDIKPLEERTIEVCADGIDELLGNCETTVYNVPISLNVKDAFTSVDTISIGKTDTKLSYTFAETHYLKIGESSIIIIGDTSYSSIDTNISQETGYAHLNTSETSPYNNLVMYVPFDVNSSTNAYDYSKYQIDGVMNGGRWDNTTYNGLGGYLNCLATNNTQFDDPNDLTDFETLAQNFSISWWMKVNGTIDTNDRYFTRANSAGDGWQIVDNGANTAFVIERAGDQDLMNFLAGDFGSTWTHYVLVYNYALDDMWFYRNGTLHSTGSVDTAGAFAWGGASDLSLCGRIGGAYSPLLMDELMIFNNTLSATDVTNIYNNQSGRFYGTGEMKFTGINFGTNTKTNITIKGCEYLKGGNLSAKINAGSYVNFGGCSVKEYNITGNLVSANLSVKPTAGISAFYSPIVIGNITLDDWGGTGDSCTCAGANTNWEIDMSDYCIITTNCELVGGNITFVNEGNCTFDANINATQMKYPTTNQILYMKSNGALNLG